MNNQEKLQGLAYMISEREILWELKVPLKADAAS